MPYDPSFYGIFWGQKSCRTKVSRIFRIFVPNFALNFAPNFSRISRGLFVLRFVGDGDQKKFTKNPCHFSMQNSQANTKKIFTKFFWRAGKVTYFGVICFAHLRGGGCRTCFQRGEAPQHLDHPEARREDRSFVCHALSTSISVQRLSS